MAQSPESVDSEGPDRLENRADRKLSRDLGLTSVVAVSLGAMLGSGLFVLPGLAAARTGPSVWLAYALAALLILPAALSKAELATAIPQAGGTYLYIERSMGPLIGTSVGLGLWLSLLLKACFAIIGIGAYLVLFMAVPLDITIFLLLAGVMILNIVGVKKVSVFQVVVVVICVAAIGPLTCQGLNSMNWSLLRPHVPYGALGLLSAAGFVFVSYDGVTKIAAVAEEVKNPGRNIPAGILLSLFIMAAIYSLVALALVGNIDYHLLVRDAAPVAALGRTLFGKVGTIVVVCVAVLALISATNAGMLAASRFPLAMSRDSLLPSPLAAISRKYLTPVPAIVLTAVVMAIVILIFKVERIVKLASTFQIMIFALVNISVIIFRESGAQWYRPKFKTPGYPWIQIAGIVGGVVVVVLMGTFALLSAFVVGVMGVLWYLVYGRRKVDRKGLLSLLLSRKEITRPLVPLPAGEEAAPKPAEVVMPLFGWERSSETLLRLSAALAVTSPMKILHLKEVPDQTQLEDLAHEKDMMESLQRRLKALASDLKADAHFDSVVSRSNRKTLHELVRQLGCQWVVMEWRRASGLSNLVYNPLEWLIKHLPCNVALFKDTGITVFREIAVVAEPGPHDALVAHTAGRLQGIYGARLTYANILPPGASSHEIQSVSDYHDQLRKLCGTSAESRVMVTADRVSEITRLSARSDLLLMGAPPERSLWGMVFGDKEKDRIMDQALCSVLRLNTSHGRTRMLGRTAERSACEKSVLDYLRPECVMTKLAVKRKDVLFNKISEAFARMVDCSKDAGRIQQAFWAREEMQNTAVGKGVALPHATLEGADMTHLGVFTLQSPMEYQAFDGQPVEICLATLGPPRDRQTHLLLLAMLARLIMSTRLIEDLKSAVEPHQAMAAFEDAVRLLERLEKEKQRERVEPA